MKRTRRPTLAMAIAIDAVLVVVTALIAWSFAPGPARGSGAPAPAKSVVAAARQKHAAPRPGKTPALRPRSPLERSAGYIPPDDPESLSVITGRRNAPPVALELTGGASSLADLARLLLADLQAKDERAMHALRVTRREFEVICWPEFPVSRPITRISVGDAWELALPTSLAGAGRTIGLHGGRDLSLVRVTAGRAERYRNFTLHRDVVITAREAQAGDSLSLRFVPSVVERHGRFKALLFKD
jgi:hypothetical protein